VSTWHTVHPTINSETPSVINGQPPRKFGNALSVSAISLNNVSRTSVSDAVSIKSTGDTPTRHRPFTEEEIQQFTSRNSTDLGDERLKVFLESTRDQTDDESDHDTTGFPSGPVPRRSLRTFRSRKKRQRTIKRTRSMEAARAPTIMVTCPSMEDRSKTMVRVVHL